jgi:hypothetical protein
MTGWCITVSPEGLSSAPGEQRRLATRQVSESRPIMQREVWEAALYSDISKNGPTS